MLSEKAAEHITQRLSHFICDANADIMRFTRNRRHIHNSGVEGYVSGYIANRVFIENLLIEDEYCEYVNLEVNVLNYIESSSPDIRTGRFDIVCFNSNDNAILIIEVKRYFSPSAFKQDATRLVMAVQSNGTNAGGTLRGAAMVGIAANWGSAERTTAAVQLENFESTVRDYDAGIHTWGATHEMPVLIDDKAVPRKVTGFAIVIRG